VALNITERSSEDIALGATRNTMGVALVHRESPAERERGLAVMGQVRDMCLRGRFYVFMLPVVDVWPRGSGPGAATATVRYLK
jgi:adenylate cyclase